jgi:hypothetical protein
MKYAVDPVVEEIRETRKKLLAQCGNDIKRYGEFIAAQAVKRKAVLRKRVGQHA